MLTHVLFVVANLLVKRVNWKNWCILNVLLLTWICC